MTIHQRGDLQVLLLFPTWILRHGYRSARWRQIDQMPAVNWEPISQLAYRNPRLVPAMVHWRLFYPRNQIHRATQKEACL